MNIIQRAKSIILKPKLEWETIASEEPNVAQLFTGYVIPLALIPAAATVIGLIVFSGGIITSFNWVILTGVIQFVATVVGVYITAFVVDALAQHFESQKNIGRATQLVAYSFTPAWVAGVCNIIPFLGWVAIIGSIYGIYILFLGFPPLMKTPKDKVPIYLIITMVILIIVYFIIGAVLSSLLFASLGLNALTI
ncbi:MAG: Yip1 family protein [Candidatus Zixiibacteriota bacterium]